MDFMQKSRICSGWGRVAPVNAVKISQPDSTRRGGRSDEWTRYGEGNGDRPEMERKSKRDRSYTAAWNPLADTGAVSWMRRNEFEADRKEQSGMTCPDVWQGRE